MFDLPHTQKFRLIVKRYERDRAASDGDSTLSPRRLAENECGISRTSGHILANGGSIKDPGKLTQFENVFRMKVFAEPGSSSYQSHWADVKNTVDKTRAEPRFSRELVPAAYGHWSAIALDENRSDADRILVGRMAEFVLYHFARTPKDKLLTGLPERVDPEAAKIRGREVIDSLVGILSAHPTPPDGLFEQGSKIAQEQGYRMLRIRLHGDYTGWRYAHAVDWRFSDAPRDTERTRVLEDAYRTGQAQDLMWLHEELEGSDVGHPNSAFVLATHAGDWLRAGEYGARLLQAFPALLTERVKDLSALLDDRTVWPGVAAMMVHRWLDIPAGCRAVLEAPSAQYDPAMALIRRMVPAVEAGASYLSALKTGE